jgi:type III secretion protein J
VPRWLDLCRAFYVVLVAGLIGLAGCSSRVELFSGATDGEANDILAALLQSNIPAEKLAKKNGTAISVAEADVARALDVLREHGLPRERFEGMGKIFHKEGMISSPLEERARYIYALSQELENTLTKMDGVLVARVHVVLPEQDAARVVKTPASAAVFIKHRPGYNLDLFKPQIRTLVAHAIPELGEDRVSVILVPTQRSPQIAGPSTAAPFAPGRPAPAAVVPPVADRPADGASPGRLDTLHGPVVWTLGLAMLACAIGTAVWWARRRRAGMALQGATPDMRASPDSYGPG